MVRQVNHSIDLDQTQYLLIKASEESTEVAQACTKALTFGLYSKIPGHESTHVQDILHEFYELDAVIEELQSLGIIPSITKAEELEIKAEKKRKMKKYMKGYGVI